MPWVPCIFLSFIGHEGNQTEICAGASARALTGLERLRIRKKMKDSIGELKGTIPELFEEIPLPEIDWDERELIPVDADGRIFDRLDIGDILLPDTSREWPDFGPKDRSLSGSNDLGGRTNGGYGGSLVGHNKTRGLYPPTDALAFYMPYHFFYPYWWGIYFTWEGLVSLGAQIMSNARPRPSSNEALKAAHCFLYYHEAFHHRVECFATRLELVNRKPYYRTAFKEIYNRTALTNGCLEEALANATAANEVSKKLKNPAIDEVILDYMRGQPPGYNQAELFLGVDEFREARSKFAEMNRAECLGCSPEKNTGLWDSVGYLFNGNTNIKSRINYLVPKDSPINARLPGLRPVLPPRKLVKKLGKLVGLRHVRSGANHEIFESRDGRRTQIPRHNKDLKKGLVKGILKDLGLDISLDEFQQL